MNKEELNKFFESLSPSREQKDRVFSKIQEGENDMKITKKKISAALIAAIILIFTGITVMAATINWHGKFIDYFRPTNKQIQELQEASDIPQASGTDNGVTINVLQTLADKHGLYVLYEAILPDNTEITTEMIDNDLQWEYDFIGIDSESRDNVMGIGGSSKKILDFDSKKVTILENVTTNGKYKNNQEISLSIENLCYYIQTENDIIQHKVLDFSINLKWNFNYIDSTKTINVDKKVDINGSNHNILKTIDVSPMSIWISIEGDDVMMGIRPIIKFKDGQIIQLEIVNDFNTSYNFANFLDRDGGVITIGYNFDKITNISDIESVTVGDTIVRIE